MPRSATPPVESQDQQARPAHPRSSATAAAGLKAAHAFRPAAARHSGMEQAESSGPLRHRATARPIGTAPDACLVRHPRPRLARPPIAMRADESSERAACPATRSPTATRQAGSLAQRECKSSQSSSGCCGSATTLSISSLNVFEMRHVTFSFVGEARRGFICRIFVGQSGGFPTRIDNPMPIRRASYSRCAAKFS